MKYSLRFVIFFCLIVSLAFFLRFYKIADLPHSLYVDEVAIGYNAYSILKTGKDEYGSLLPMSLRSYNDYKLPLYAYLTSGSIFLFGKNPFAVRFPAAFLGVSTVMVFISLVHFLTGKRKMSLLAGLLLAISPWHLQFTRAGFEASAALFFILLGTFLVLFGLIRQKMKAYFVGIGFFIISLYTYHSSRIFVPLLLIVLSIVYLEKLKKLFVKKSSLTYLFVCLILVVPFAHYAISSDGLSRAVSQNFTREVKISADNMFSVRPFLIAEQYLKNYTRYFSLDFLFFWGDQQGRHSVRDIGENFVWQVPFFLVGLFVALGRMKKETMVFVFFALISPIAAAFATPNPHALRSLPLIIPVTYFISVGIINLNSKFGFRILLTLACVYFLISYLHIYYVHYSKTTSPDWSGGYKEVMDSVNSLSPNYQKVYISNHLLRGYEYLYFYGNFDPADLIPMDQHMEGFGKFQFVDSPFQSSVKEKFIYASPFWEVRSGGKLLKKVYNQGGDWVFSIWEN